MPVPLLVSAALSLAAAASTSDTLEFTTIHTLSSNWLATTLHPLAECRSIEIDSVRVADQVVRESDGTIILFLGPPRRRVELWWHVVSPDPGTRCASRTVGARNLLRLPRPRKSPGSDTLLSSWIVADVVSHGPDGDAGILPVRLVDQAGDESGPICPLYSCYMVVDTAAPPPVAEVRDSLSSWIGRDGALALVTTGGEPTLVEGDFRDTDLVRNLGAPSPSNLGDQAWREFQPIRVLQSWGEPVPAVLSKATGRRFYRWTGTALGACCDHCDTTCIRFPMDGEVFRTGGELRVSNDSTDGCTSEIDQGMGSALDGTWLIRPLREELATGRLSTTFGRPGVCGGAGRSRSFKVVGDSLFYRTGRYAFSDLLPVSGVRPSTKSVEISVRATSSGWTVAGPEGTAIRLLDLHGRILHRGSLSGPLELAAPGRGVFLLQAGPRTLPLVR